MAAAEEAKSLEPAVEPSETRAKGRTVAAEPAAIPQADGVMIAFTLDTHSGHIGRIEGVDASGSRRELTAEEKARLLAKAAEVTLEGVVERAFEAGLECALADGEDEDFAEQAAALSEEDLSLRRAVLRSLMEDTVADRLIKREVLNRAIAGTLIRQGVAAQTITH